MGEDKRLFGARDVAVDIVILFFNHNEGVGVSAYYLPFQKKSLSALLAGIYLHLGYMKSFVRAK